MIKQLQSREGDIGSTPVQSKPFHILTALITAMSSLVGIMTVRIKALQEHNRLHPKVIYR